MHRAFCRTQSFLLCTEPFSCAQSFFLCTEPFPVHRAFCRAQSFFLCRAQAQSLFLSTELSAVHRAFCCAQSFLLCTELFPVHRAFSCAQSFLLCTELFPVPCTGTELFPVRRAFSCAQSFFLCTEPFPVHRAFCRAQSFPLCTELRFGSLCNLGLPKTLRFSLQRHKTPEFGEAEFWDCTPEFYGGILYWLLEKQGKLYFLQSSQTKGIDVLAAFATLVCQRHCVFLCKGTKLKIVMPVFCGTETDYCKKIGGFLSKNIFCLIPTVSII